MTAILPRVMQRPIEPGRRDNELIRVGNPVVFIDHVTDTAAERGKRVGGNSVFRIRKNLENPAPSLRTECKLHEMRPAGFDERFNMRFQGLDMLFLRFRISNRLIIKNAGLAPHSRLINRNNFV